MVNGLNLYAYCGDNPVMLTDSTGCSPWSDFWSGVGDGFVGFFQGLWHAVTHPIETITGLWNSLTTDPWGTIYHMFDFINPYEYYKAYESGGWYGLGSHVGESAGTVTLMVATFAVGKAISQISKINTFTSKASLGTHFTKHGANMGYASAKAYAKGAKYVIKSGTKVKYLYNGKLATGYIRFFGKGGGANFAFVGMKGLRVATFHIKHFSDLIRLGIIL